MREREGKSRPFYVRNFQLFLFGCNFCEFYQILSSFMKAQFVNRIVYESCDFTCYGITEPPFILLVRSLLVLLLVLDITWLHKPLRNYVFFILFYDWNKTGIVLCLSILLVSLLFIHFISLLLYSLEYQYCQYLVSKETCD